MAEAVGGKRRRALEGSRSGKRAKVGDGNTVHEVGNRSERFALSVATCVSLQVREDGEVSGSLERKSDYARNDVAREEGDSVRCEEGEGVRCGFEFYNQACEDLARSMLGCVLVCAGGSGEECRGRVVETEAYLGGEDKAAHSYNGRQSKANEAMFMVRRGGGEGGGGGGASAHHGSPSCSLLALPMCTPYMACTAASMCRAAVMVRRS